MYVCTRVHGYVCIIINIIHFCILSSRTSCDKTTMTSQRYSIFIMRWPKINTTINNSAVQNLYLKTTQQLIDTVIVYKLKALKWADAVSCQFPQL